MTVIGTIQVFNEEVSIAGAVVSLLEGGCNRVVVVDGAWANPDGTPFGGGDSWVSTDGTREAALAAGAEWVDPNGFRFKGGDTEKRDFMLHVAGATDGDHLLLLDADERLHGRLSPRDWPEGHGCIRMLNEKPNDVEGRTEFLCPEHRASVPMLKWFRWSPTLRCVGPGRYEDGGTRINAYLVNALAQRAREHTLGALEQHALRALRAVEIHVPDDLLAVLPIVPGVVVRHCVEASPDRVGAKAAYYGVREPVAA